MRINHQELANVEPANLMINTNPKIWDNRNISLDMISRKNSDLEIKNESNDFILDTNKVSYLFS